MARHATEPGTAVLQGHPRSRRDDPGTERLVDALNERDGHPVSVHRAEEGGAAAREVEAGVEGGPGPHGVEAGGGPGRTRTAGGRERPGGEEIRGQWAIVNECMGIVERKLHRLNLEV